MSTTTTVELRWSDGEVRTVEAERVGDWFAVHEAVRSDGADQDTEGDEASRWQATHVATGLALPRRFRTEEGVTYYATALTALADWSGSDRQVLAQRAKAASRAVWKATEDAEAADLTAWCDRDLPAWPHDKPPSADQLARFATVQAALLGHRVTDLVDAGALDKGAGSAELHAYFDTTVAFLNAWSTAYLLRALQQHVSETVAADLAGDLWNAIESGDAPNIFAWDWLVEYRIDPTRVAAEHAEYKARRAARQHEADSEPA
jgi:hypothetical protein